MRYCEVGNLSSLSVMSRIQRFSTRRWLPFFGRLEIIRLWVLRLLWRWSTDRLDEQTFKVLRVDRACKLAWMAS